MPHIVVKLYPGTPEGNKAKIAEGITKLIQEQTGKPEEYISVDIQEVSEDVWMDEVYNKEIKPNFDKLYKKPGY
jgi:4-oxalocrotonate tautomerase